MGELMNMQLSQNAENLFIRLQSRISHSPPTIERLRSTLGNNEFWRYLLKNLRVAQSSVQSLQSIIYQLLLQSYIS
ncbi:hypothetical protein FGO68_gene645 [Halteria grandinella]|uniref:Uncharacterized protein n=1 Tax=Halteria grandinella TaxID=5974 RepID=A0A8J8T1N3_HALGN|nr:hypothetical protein FGO68_gene645 [Halteria grandinella]